MLHPVAKRFFVSSGPSPPIIIRIVMNFISASRFVNKIIVITHYNCNAQYHIRKNYEVDKKIQHFFKISTRYLTLSTSMSTITHVFFLLLSINYFE